MKNKMISALLATAMVASMMTVPALASEGETEAAATVDLSNVEAKEAYHFEIVSKGFQHQYWQAVLKGAQEEADRLGVTMNFVGPNSESDIADQVQMLNSAINAKPAAIGLAALSTDACNDALQQAKDAGIPIVGFDSGVPDDKTGAVKATASTNNENAAAIAAEKFGENEVIVEAMKNADSKKPVIIGCLSQDAVSASITGRTTGFVNKMAEIAEMYQPGKVSIEGHAKWEKKVADPAIIIEVAVSATTEATAVQTAANSLLGKKPVAIFCSNEGAVTGFLSAVSDGEDLAEGGKYGDIIVAGFDAGAAQKNAVRNGWFYGSVTQDPYQIGYKAVEMAVMAAKGESVSDVDTGAQWYNAENIDDEMISLLVYD